SSRMSPRIPVVETYMSASPHSIGGDQTLATARTLMRKHKIRHLPVMRAGKLIGLCSARDLDFVESLAGIDPEKVVVEDAMSQEPYCVPPDAPLDEVALEMSRRRYGCAIVLRDGKLTGMFTAVDAMRILAETLRRSAAGADKPLPPPRSRRVASRSKKAAKAIA
ncbi:MAG: CBS domain-containing protein, partial [Deltaproteobacteria bacterium]